ncbi:MAG: pyridoxal-phosphate dependent enzyme [Bacteroidetes bacterium]|nr:pyridoxal-phosphate dependent enzyme [Bacteroidota bacterium]
MLLQPLGIFNENVSLDILREDLRHPFVSGNKWWKLKYNLEEAKRLKVSAIVTFGGAYSNHLSATAAAGKEHNIKTIGLVRGEELDGENSTLRFCKQQGMELHFLSRAEYRSKDISRFSFSDVYVIPEGGSNKFGVQGCTEMLAGVGEKYDFIVCACGTGATLSGLILSALPHQKLIGIPVLKGGGFLNEEIENHLSSFGNTNKNWELALNYHCGGYGKISDELVSFIRMMKEKHDLPLDGIYTGKMLMGVMDLLSKNYFPNNSKVLLIHSGGLQGNEGIKERFGIDLSK